MAYIIVETHDPMAQPIKVYGPVETREEAFDMKVRLAHTVKEFLKVVEINDADKLDPFNYEGNRRIEDEQ